VAEAIDWVHAAQLLGIDRLDEDGIEATLGSVLKYREDHDVARAATLRWVADATRSAQESAEALRDAPARFG
jgi:hypothetical protein